MKKGTKVWLIIAAALTLIGIIIFGGVMTVAKWDFKKLSTEEFNTREFVIEEEFSDIAIEGDTEDIVFERSDAEKCRVVCYESDKDKHTVTVKDGSLFIKSVNTKKWYEHISLCFESGHITVYLPNEKYGALNVDTSTGDVKIPADFSFESIDVKVSTGKIKCAASAEKHVKLTASTGAITVENVKAEELSLKVTTGSVKIDGAECMGNVTLETSTGKSTLTDVSCKSISSKGSTGDIKMENVVATKDFSVKRSTGKVTLEKCDGAYIYIKTDTGDVQGSFVTDKMFFTKTDTGRVKVPRSTTGGKCEIETDTGDIIFE